MSTVYDISSINTKIINSVNIKHTSVIVSFDRIIGSVERKIPIESD